MGVKAKPLTTAQTVQVLNTVRANSSALYQSMIPEIILDDMADGRSIGAIFSAYPSLMLELSQGLWGQVAEVYWGSLPAGDPWMVLDGPEVRPGDTIQETYIDIARPFQYQASNTPWDLFTNEDVDAKTVFHHLNLKDYVKQTIWDVEIEQAFNSWDGVTQYINRVLYNMVESVNYCVFQAKKYMIARAMLNGNLYPIQIPTVSSENAKSVTTSIKNTINNMRFPSRTYNIAGVMNSSPVENLIVIVNTYFNALSDVEVLAQAYNIDRAQFLDTYQLLTDGFGQLDTEWLNLMFDGQSGYEEISTDDMEKLNAVPAVVVDRGFLISRPFKRWHEDIRNPQEASVLHWEHFWYILGISPFAQAALFTPEAPGVTGVTVSPSAVTASVGQMVQFTAAVQTTGFAPEGVTWESSDPVHAPVSSKGIVSLLTGATGPVTITATSIYDTTKKGQGTITIQ